MRRVVSIGLSVYSAFLWAFETQVHLYRPFTDTAKHPPMRIEATQAGACQVFSWLSTRQDAWRCLSQGQAYDPCFVNRFGDHKTVFCPQEPWSGQGVLLQLDSPLPARTTQPLDMSRHLPWAVELQQGARCLAVAPGQEYDQLPVRYSCGPQGVLIGYIQRCSGRWKMLQYDSQDVKHVEIVQAWF